MRIFLLLLLINFTSIINLSAQIDLNPKKRKKQREEQQKKEQRKTESKKEIHIPFGYVKILPDVDGFLYVDEKEYPILASQAVTIPIEEDSKYYVVYSEKDFRSEEKKIAVFEDMRGDTLSGDVYNLNIKEEYIMMNRGENEAIFDDVILNSIIQGFTKIKPSTTTYTKYGKIWFGKHEITVAQYALYKRKNPNNNSRVNASKIIDSNRKNKFTRIEKEGVNWQHDAIGQEIGVEKRAISNHPVTNISWQEAKAFCDWLSENDRDFNYRLPKRDEWLYFAQCSVYENRYPWGNEIGDFKYAGNFRDSSIQKVLQSRDSRFEKENDGYAYTSPIGNYVPNCFGLYDMGGNVAEWLEDEYYDSRNPSKEGAVERQYIGGSYFTMVNQADLKEGRIASLPENVRNSGIGFRLVKEKKIHLGEH